MDSKTPIVIIWPRSRGNRWRLGKTCAASEPDHSDALLFLEQHGFDLAIEDSTPFPLNPFVRMHEFWSGLDFARAARLWGRSSRYNLVVGVGDAVAYYLVWARKLLGWKMPIVLIDPALSQNYPRRQRLQDLVLPSVNKVIVFGQVQLDYLQDRYGDRVDAELVLHRADCDFYCPGPASTTSESPFVVSVGGDKSRDFGTLVQAVEIAQKTVPDLRCVIKTQLDVASDSAAVHVDGNKLSWVELRDLYRRARFVVLPLHDSLHAGGINTLIEAMSIGKGVIVSDSKGIRDYTRDGETTWLVPPADPRALAEAMIRLWRQPELAETLGTRARQFVLEKCDQRVYAAQIARILREVFDHSKKPPTTKQGLIQVPGKLVQETREATR